MDSGYGHVKVEELHNVMESFVESFVEFNLFIIGFQLECLLHSVPAVGQLGGAFLSMKKMKNRRSCAMPDKAPRPFGI
jgi:hypothetical protein